MTNSEINEFLGEFDHYDPKQELIEKLENLQRSLDIAMQPLMKPVLKSNYIKDELIDYVFDSTCKLPYIHKLVLVYMIHNYDEDISHSVQDIIDATGLSSASVKRALGALRGSIIRHPLYTGYTYNPEKFK